MLGYHQSFLKPMAEIVWECGQRDTFQIFTRNARNTAQRQISQQEIDQFNFVLMKSPIQAFVVHAPYVMNPASPDEEKRRRAARIIQEDMNFMAKLAGVKYYVLHPGSHLGAGKLKGLRNLQDTLSKVNARSVTICLENMAGGGTELLSTKDEIDFALVAIGCPIAFDTAHCYQSGQEPEEWYERFHKRIAVVHLNSSATAFGSQHDIHSNFSEGTMDERRLKELYQQIPETTPVILETPYSGIDSDYSYLKN